MFEVWCDYQLPRAEHFENLADVQRLKRSQCQVLGQHWKAGDKDALLETCLTQFLENDANFAKERLDAEVERNMGKENYDFYTLVSQMFRQKPPVSRTMLSHSCYENITGNLLSVFAENIYVHGLIKDCKQLNAFRVKSSDRSVDPIA